jgi:hypothetical protein
VWGGAYAWSTPHLSETSAVAGCRVFTQLATYGVQQTKLKNKQTQKHTQIKIPFLYQSKSRFYSSLYYATVPAPAPQTLLASSRAPLPAWQAHLSPPPSQPAQHLLQTDP